MINRREKEEITRDKKKIKEKMGRFLEAFGVKPDVSVEDCWWVSHNELQKNYWVEFNDDRFRKIPHMHQRLSVRIKKRGRKFELGGLGDFNIENVGIHLFGCAMNELLDLVERQQGGANK